MRACTNADEPMGAFWEQLLNVADAIEESEGSLEDLHGYLLALEEGYSDAFDPAQQFPEYAAILLCRSIKRQLETRLRASGDG